jgi:hypothetical protein
MLPLYVHILCITIVEAFMVVLIQVDVFWVVMPCSFSHPRGPQIELSVLFKQLEVNGKKCFK